MKLLGLEIRRSVPAWAKALFWQIQAARQTGLERQGVGQEWAPTTFSQYMATSVPVYRAVTLRANAVATARLRVHQQVAGGEPQVVSADHPVQVLLDKVNAWWTQVDLLIATETYLSLLGVAYWWVEKQGGVPVAIWPLRPEHMRVMPPRDNQSKGGYIDGFLYSPSSTAKAVPLLPDEVVWFRRFNPMSEYAGLSPVAPARLSLDMGRNAVKYNSAFFANDASPSRMIFSTPQDVTKEQAEEFYRALEERHKGAANAHRPMLAGSDLKPVTTGLSQRDMEFLATLNYTVEDAARVWGVPPPKMYSQTSSTYNNVKQADQEFYTDTISAEWRFIEAEINEMLMPLFGDPSLFVAFDTSAVLPLQEALAELHTREREDVRAGILTINEVRANRHLGPVPWGDEKPAPTPGPFTLAETPQRGAEAVTGALPALVGKSMAFTPPQTDAIADVFEKRLTRSAAIFQQMQRELFSEQRAAVLSRLMGEKGLRREMGDVFDQEEWTLLFKARGKPLMFKALVEAAVNQARDLHLGPFNPSLARVQEWVDERVNWWAQQANETTAKLLIEELREGAQIGEGIPQLMDRVEKVFAFNSSIRAERIARTETLAASNAGHLELYHQAGVEGKEWISARDERTRETHLEAHGQVQPLGSPFVVGGELLEAPGIGGSAAETVNCRCTLIPAALVRKAMPAQRNGIKGGR